MAKLLVCDDESGLRAVILRYAQHEGHEVREAADGQEAVEACRAESFDLIVMDVMMPRLDGFSALQEIRAFSDTPVIMLTARGEEYDKVRGFELGVDDYVVKPFSSKELMMRITAILRRSRSVNEDTSSTRTEAPDTYVFEGLLVDLGAYRVFVDREEVTMAPKAYELLFYLIRNRNIVLSRDRIMEAVWGYDYEGDDRTLDTHMKWLRRALGPYANQIKTLRGVGYRLDG